MTTTSSIASNGGGFLCWTTAICCVALLPYAVAAPRCAGMEPPGLIVLVCVDQFPYEYLERFREGFVPSGVVRRCQAGGLLFTNCHHEHAYTFTGPGHAALSTGAHPSATGIIGNDLFDRRGNRTVYAVLDRDAKLIGKAQADDRPVSPRSLQCETLGDRLKIASGGAAKVFGVGIKDRASLLLAGRGANAAYWMSNAGEWITCDHYRPDLPGYLRQLNTTLPGYAGRTWELLLPPARYRHGAAEDNLGERPLYGLTAGFPHVLPAATDQNFIKQLAANTFGNDVTLAAARELIVHEQLGLDGTTDLLSINLSSNDYVGHAFGPHSLEVEDLTYRTDEALGQLVDFTNRQLRGKPWVIVVTSDHGVCPIPELLEKRFKIPAQREPFGPIEKETGNWTQLAATLEAFLRDRLRVDSPPSLVQAVTEQQVFLRRDHPALAGEQWRVAQELARDGLLANPKIAAAVTREQLLTGQMAGGLQQAFRNSFHAERGGDVLFALKPYHFQGFPDAATTHGSPWSYDTHVPLIILPQGGRWGESIVPRSIHRRIGITSVVASLAAVTGVTPPSMCRAEPLPEVVDLLVGSASRESVDK